MHSTAIVMRRDAAGLVLSVSEKGVGEKEPVFNWAQSKETWGNPVIG